VEQTGPEGTLIVGNGPISLDDIVEVARGNLVVELGRSDEFVARIERSMGFLQDYLDRGIPVYGVTTGFGGSCGHRLHANRTRHLGNNLLKYHGCGTGEPLGIEETRATMLCRLICLVQGYSGVSWGLLEQLVAFLNKGVTPVVPQQGSVGASGDLTPLSYVGATMAGQRNVFYEGGTMPAAEALERAGLKPYRFLPKEPLAIVNGTSVMTGIAVIAVDKARRVLDAATTASALSVHALAGHAHHFRPAIFEAKPFEGQGEVAARLRFLLDSVSRPPEATEPDSLQDPYSVRCSPHVLGVLSDSLKWISHWVEVEANGVSDNPLFHLDSGELLTGGNFYGGHIAFAMDALKPALASVADMSDRQIALMVDKRFNRGLPSCLAGTNGDGMELHHGFKAVQITASALTAEALKNTMPAAVFSRSTESHNQDKVSMGTIAARDAASIGEMVARVVAIHFMAAAQGCELRGGLDSRPNLAVMIEAIRRLVPRVKEDRPMDTDIERLASAILEDSEFIETA